MKRLFFLLSFTLFFFTCDEDGRYQYEIDEENISNYVEENNIDATRHSSGMYYVIEEEGIGDHPSSSASVIVNYKGYFLDGTVFDEGQNVSFSLQSVISGWQVALPLLARGGKGLFIFTSNLGYYDQQVRVFEIELIDFN